MEGAQQDQILLNFAPSPLSYLIAANSFLKTRKLPPNDRSSVFSLSKCTGLFYAYVGHDYKMMLIRNNRLIGNANNLRKVFQIYHDLRL